VLLAYLDESYTKERYYIAALVVPEAEAISLTSALDEVVQKASDSYGAKHNAEVHGKDLFQAQGDWRALGKPRQRIGIYNDAFKAIAEHEVSIIVRGVHIGASRKDACDLRSLTDWS
jgi:hypothetical protein